MSNNAPFKLKGFKNLFSPTDPSNIKQEVINIETRYLQHFSNHPFKLYTDERLNDMVESIKTNGIISPLIVQEIPDDNFNYEVLAGHNRLEAAKIAGLDYVPCIIKKGLSDDEAMLLVTESNLIQRSFSDLTHSERAAVLTGHHEAMKQQGKRTDIINEIETMLKASDSAENSTLSPLDTKLDNIKSVGGQYDISRANVARYLRVSTLIQELKDRLDNNELSIRAAVTLSYLTEPEQQIVNDLLDTGYVQAGYEKS